MDTALDTGVDRATDLAQRLEAILRRGDLYENVVASDNSNIHNGDRIYVTYNVTYNTSSSYGYMPMVTDRYPPDVLCDRPGQLLRKRKQATDDIEDAVRTGVGYHRRSLEMSLSSLGDLSSTTECVEIGAKAMRIATYLSTILEAMKQVDGTKAVSEDIASRVEDLPHQLGRTKCIKVNAAFSQQQVTVLLRDSRRISGVTIGDWRLSLTANVEGVRRPYSRQACAILYAQPPTQ